MLDGDDIVVAMALHRMVRPDFVAEFVGFDDGIDVVGFRINLSIPVPLAIVFVVALAAVAAVVVE